MTAPEELIAAFDPDERFLLADGFSEALVGVVAGWWSGNHQRFVALYDYERCVQILVAEGMDEDESREYVFSTVRVSHETSARLLAGAR